LPEIAVRNGATSVPVRQGVPSARLFAVSAPARTPADLVDQLATGHRLTFLFFWGHRPNRDGSIGRGCLSQWWPAPFDLDGHTFATAEHYMMWRKALLFDDAPVAERILAATHPKEAKELGRAIGGFDQRRWAADRYQIVVAGNTAKFGQHEDLRKFLLGTGDRVLVEASPLDAIWGIGVAADDPRAGDPATWPGLNLLGFALGEVRASSDT
jgi:ribA/ribD-fused uncharacterized protein